MSSLQPWWFLQYLRLRHLILKLVLFRQFFVLKRQNKRGLVATIRQCKSGSGEPSQNSKKSFWLSRKRWFFANFIHWLKNSHLFQFDLRNCSCFLCISRWALKKRRFSSTEGSLLWQWMNSASKKVISFTLSISQLQSSFDLKVRVLNPTREFGISSQTCPTLIIVLKRQGKRCLFASILLC